jgi:hypothetical protein
MSVGAGGRHSDLPAKNDNAVCLTNRGACIAGKPRSHKELRSPVGAGGRHSGLPAKNANAVYLTNRGA